ncbi:MAG: alpha/beta fold hydrolase [Clostridiaceae bacterium]
MKKVKKYLPLALLAALPLAYRKLHARSLASQLDFEQLLLPDPFIPANDFYIPEESYSQMMADLVMPYLNAHSEIAVFETGHRIHYAHYRADQPIAAVVIAHGFAETLGRYAEVIYYFLKMGYEVYLPEHFGHGESEAGVADPSVVWVGDFNDYTADFSNFVKDIVRPKHPTLPIIGYGHSMGGAILATALMQHPNLCDAAIFNSPMFKVFFDQPEGLLYPLIQTLAKTKLNKAGIPLKTPLDHLKVPEFMPKKAAMHSQPRARYFHDLRILSDKPVRWLVSWGWLNESIQATHQIVKPENIEKIKIPLLMFESETDWFVDPIGIHQFASSAKNLTFYKVPGSYHEIYSETNNILVPYFNTINEFISHFLENRP